MAKDKVSVVGVGMVGTVAAQKILEKKLARELVLIDVNEGVAKGKALDLAHLAALQNLDCKVVGSSDFKAIKNSRLVVIAAGFPRQKGMTREELLVKNFKIIKSIAEKIKEFAEDAIVIVVTNPLDAMALAVLKFTGFKPAKVMGMAGVLDSTRFRYHIAEEAQADFKDVKGMVIGGHSAKLMVPLVSSAKVKRKPLEKALTGKQIENVVEKTKKAGAVIADHLKWGTAFLCPGTAVAEMAEAIIKNQKKVLPASVWLDGKYGLKGVCMGVPVKLGRQGAKIVEVPLSPQEKEQLKQAFDYLKSQAELLKLTR